MPGITAPAVAYAEQERTLLTIEQDLSAMRDVARRAESVRQQLTEASKKLTDSAVVRDVNTLQSRLVSVMDVYAPMVYVHARVNTLTPQVRASSRDLFTTLHRDWETLRPGLESALGADLDALNAN